MRHGRAVEAPPASRSGRRCVGGSQIRAPLLLNLSGVWPPDTGGIFCGFCVGLVALSTVVPDGSVHASSCGRELSSPVHQPRLPPPLLVTTALASPVYASVSFVVDTVPTRHGVTHALAVVGLAAPVSTGALGSPSSPLSLSPTVAPTGLVEQTLLGVSKDLLCSPLDLDDEHLSPDVLLHISYEVVSQLDRVEDFRSLSPDKQDLYDFLED
jgi:hypothetical protein